ncbi:ACP phosphodiesterase [Polluticoccus soli]|uniref:acyl carrier protein phosphodiesterase n=1 Tax=Polluticoccus soli TaxID=3034150 RepID=UPI0023E16981|nr:ACP phosphodiesterase [Flavipsychrobacter sp. JY13-12]
MNYLGHAFLSFGDAEILTGNMIGDHVKGKLALDKFPEGIKKGILLHRKIDSFADVHPATLRGKLWFREDYGLYAGAIMDTVFDHYLANDAKHFNSEKELLNFTQQTYKTLEQNSQWFPESFATYFPYMQQHNWLYNYRTLQGINKSMNGLNRRAQHMPPVEKAYEIFVTNYYQLAQCYYELIDDVVSFVKVELTL